MRVLGDLMQHLRLVQRMGRTTDTDLVAAYRTGLLDQQDWAEMVQTCRGCTWAGRCDGWLDEHEHVDEAPSPCLNGARFAALRDKLEDRTREKSHDHA